MIAYKKNAIIDDYQRHILNTWVAPLTDNDVLTVSRGHSLPIDQLQTIAEFARLSGIKFSKFNKADVYERVKINYEGKTLEAYAWWQTWVECLRKGIVVNPPLAAIVPFAFGTHKAGDIIQASPHIILLNEDPHIKPCPIDMSGIVNRDLPNARVDLQHVADIMHQAKLNGAPIRNIKVEVKNNCVHNDLERQAA